MKVVLLKFCVSCGRETNDCVSFPCPGRKGEEKCKCKIVRCKACKANSVKWVCKECGAAGP
ncbi:MAG: hypothetical protein QW343_02935 [Candidatus Norongarragalinales archaeon]